MADHNNTNSNNNNNNNSNSHHHHHHHPPPQHSALPQRSSRVTGSRRSGGASDAASASAPHQTTPALPTLASAPNSGNFLPPPPPPAARTAALPPPPSVGRNSNTHSTSRTAGTPLSPLPPPPKLHTSSKMAAAATAVAGVAAAPPQSSSSTTNNVPPPTPPQSSFPIAPLPASLFPRTDPLLALRHSHIPVAVVATEQAQVVAHKNALDLTDLLNGLWIHQHHNSKKGGTNASAGDRGVPVRSVGRSLTLSWKDVSVRFRNVQSLSGDAIANQVDLPAACRLQPADGNLEQELCLLEDQVDHMLQQEQQQQNDGDDGNENNASIQPDDAKKSLAEVTRSAFQLTSPLGIPWMLRYRSALDESTNDLEHDLIACPPLILYVCTTNEAVDTIEILQSLQQLHSLPAPYHDGRWDPYHHHRKEVLVLHDNVDGPSATLDEVGLRTALQRNFGAGAALVRINSISTTTAEQLAEEESTDLWQGGGKLGNCLSMADRVTLRNYLVTLITASLLPALERRIGELNTIVSDRKKGVKNVLKSFWRTGKDDESSSAGGSAAASKKTTATDPPPATTVEYRHDTIESQTRLLADTLFLIQDYEAALSTYRLVKDDFKQDKAHMHYASVQEMMALCLYKLDPYVRAREVFSHVENALLGYSRAAQDTNAAAGRPAIAPSATRLGTRLCLVLVAAKHVCNSNGGRHLEVADLLASGSSHETALGAAVLLEQASAQYYHAGLYRKYAFHMLMAGHMFRTAQQEHHAFRCFVSALYVYREWRELHHHLRSALAAQLFAMGRMALSLQLYAKLLGSGGRVSTKSQQKFVQHLQEICRDHGKKALVGADRMAAAGPRIGSDGSAQARLDRIVEVIRYTKSAIRVLEIPNMDLPYIDNRSVHVVVGPAREDDVGSIHKKKDPSSMFGNPQRGSDEVWEEMMLATTAELKVAHPDYDAAAVTTTKALAKIADPNLRAVMGEIDRERKNQLMAARSKRSATYKEKPPVRALREPITVTFTVKNPLGIPVEATEVQLVARMSITGNDRMCTNEDAVKITPLASYDQSRTWSFEDSAKARSDPVEYSVPTFCRVSEAGRKKDDRPTWKSADEVEPFFVVTKSKLSLDPDAKQSFSASLCPLVEGDLEILGVRFRLFDDVWVLHPFLLKGRLLQNSAENRANRKRAESMLLKARVRRGMPSLKVDFLPLSSSSTTGMSPALEGQISQWKLRLSNTGTASATNIALKTNKPWINIPSRNTLGSSLPPDEQERAAHSYCVGPSGTLMELPVRGPEVQKHNEIGPGESIDVPLEVHTSGTGRHHFYFLFRYDLADAPSESDTSGEPQHRWVRKMFEMQIYPSLTMTSRLTPSPSMTEDSLLSLEFTNNRSDQPDKLELALKHVSLASAAYRLVPLSGQLSDSGAVIGWQERVTLHFRVVRNDAVSPACLLNEVSLCDSVQKESTVQATSSTKLGFMCLERTNEQFEKALSSYQRHIARAALEGEDEQPQSISSIRRANTGATPDGSNEDEVDSMVKRAHPTSIAMLAPPETADKVVNLVCAWQTPDLQIAGQHHLRELCVRQDTVFDGCPIAVAAEFTEEVVHDFGKGPALVPLKVNMHNRLVKAPVTFEFSMEYGSYDMIGPSCFRRSLEGSEGISVDLTALLNSAGVYDLQRVQLKVIGEESTTYTFDSQWMVSLVGSA